MKILIQFSISFVLCLVGWTIGLAQPGLPLENVINPSPVLPVFSRPLSDYGIFGANSFLSARALETGQSISSKAPMIPTSYDFNQLGFFCKLEVKLEHKARLPVKFRLGEVGYTEWLEYGPPR